jgi:hypothetical protein
MYTAMVGGDPKELRVPVDLVKEWEKETQLPKPNMAVVQAVRDKFKRYGSAPDVPSNRS